MTSRDKKQKAGSSGILIKKGVMVVLALVLLVSALVYLTTAWYTKMVSVSGVTFEAARWDFTANYSIDSSVVNVYEYASLEDEHAAPGTAGVIPVVLGATQSHTDIFFELTVDRSTMSEEFRDRIFFYYLKDETAGHTEVNKVYFGGSPEDPENTDTVFMSGTIPHGGETTANVYWEWIYEAPDKPGDDATAEEKAAWQETARLWDEFDTKVGKDPELYVKDMNAEITVAGAQVEPVSGS